MFRIWVLWVCFLFQLRCAVGGSGLGCTLLPDWVCLRRYDDMAAIGPLLKTGLFCPCLACFHGP